MNVPHDFASNTHYREATGNKLYRMEHRRARSVPGAPNSPVFSRGGPMDKQFGLISFINQRLELVVLR